MTILLTFQIGNKFWLRITRLRPKLQAAANATANFLGSSIQAPSSTNVLLTGDATVRRLNAQFRGVDKATNVLSFPQHEPAQVRRLVKGSEPVELGDIALGYQYTSAEAKRENKPLDIHATHLIIHGLLHLLGYNHETQRTAKRMENIEVDIMEALGLPDPYADHSEE